MLSFVNAKINLGLRVVRRLPNGYHELETIFYPVGRYNGTTFSPYPFCDLLEISTSEKSEMVIDGADWSRNEDLVMRAGTLFGRCCERKGIEPIVTAIRLEKHLPVQAGMGGGSADGAFALRMLNRINGNPCEENELQDMALQLGADCPFFLLNRPALGGGVGEKLTPLPERLKGMWCVVAKPVESISTREAFSLVEPSGESGILLPVYDGDMALWRDNLVNDFEKSFLKLHPHCARIKECLYASGAIYASLTGSGSAFYGIFTGREVAFSALEQMDTPYKAIALL